MTEIPLCNDKSQVTWDKILNWVLNAATQSKQQPCVQWYQINAKLCWALNTELEVDPWCLVQNLPKKQKLMATITFWIFWQTFDQIHTKECLSRQYLNSRDWNFSETFQIGSFSYTQPAAHSFALGCICMLMSTPEMIFKCDELASHF